MGKYALILFTINPLYAELYYMYNVLHFAFLFEYMTEVFVIVVLRVLSHYCLKIHSSALHGYTIVYSNFPLLMDNKEVCLSTYQISLLTSFAFYILPLL